MRFSVKAFGITTGSIWGAGILLVGLINLAAPAYGVEFLRGMGSLYPGFYHVRTFWDVMLGTMYGFVDGLIGGWLFAWLYNCMVPNKLQSGTVRMDRAA